MAATVAPTPSPIRAPGKSNIVHPRPSLLFFCRSAKPTTRPMIRLPPQVNWTLTRSEQFLVGGPDVAPDVIAAAVAGHLHRELDAVLLRGPSQHGVPQHVGRQADLLI